MSDISAYELNMKTIIKLGTERDKLQARVKELETALTNLVELIASDAGYISASSPTFKAARTALSQNKKKD